MLIYQAQNSVGAEQFEAIFYENFSFVPHLHRHYELTFVLEGTLKTTVEGREETLDAGTAALILPDQIHAYRSLNHTRVWVSVFSGDRVGDVSRYLSGQTGARSAFTPDAATRAYALLPLMNDSLSEAGINARLDALCAAYVDEVPLIPQREGVSTSPGRKLLAYIALNYQEPITLETAAQALGYDRSYLSRSLHRLTGTGFRHLLNAARAEHAQRLIRAGEMTMTAIAMESGFQSLRTFNRALKAQRSRESADLEDN